MTFAETYVNTADHLRLLRAYDCKFACRGLAMAKEMTPVHMEIDMNPQGVSVFSHKDHRVIPIRFVLAELCYLLSGSNDLELIASYAANMRNYSNDGKTIDGAYGYRLTRQLPAMLQRLKMDGYTRQACGVIFNEGDGVDAKTHMPCNTFMQILWRQPLMALHVTSRSSDFVTGLSIDALHWQFLLRMFAQELSTTADKVIYDIATLHVYEKDIEELNRWDVSHKLHGSFQHFLKTDITLTNATNACRAFFAPKMTLQELGDLLELDERSMRIVMVLDGLFQQHKNKIQR